MFCMFFKLCSTIHANSPEKFVHKGRDRVMPYIGGLNSAAAGPCDVHRHICCQSPLECVRKDGHNSAIAGACDVHQSTVECGRLYGQILNAHVMNSADVCACEGTSNVDHWYTTVVLQIPTSPELFSRGFQIFFKPCGAYPNQGVSNSNAGVLNSEAANACDVPLNSFCFTSSSVFSSPSCSNSSVTSLGDEVSPP